jgi:hypothetical protein
LTAWQAFTEQAHVHPGHHVLVHGGAGGVGAFAVQIAKALGARVSATASAGDIEYVRSLGADVVIDHKAAPFEEIVSDVDVVLDPIGGKTAEASLALNDGGTLISLAGPPTVTLPAGRNLSARFFIVEPERSQLIELARFVDDGRLGVDVAEVFPLRTLRLPTNSGGQSAAVGKSSCRSDRDDLKADCEGYLRPRDATAPSLIFVDESARPNGGATSPADRNLGRGNTKARTSGFDGGDSAGDGTTLWTDRRPPVRDRVLARAWRRTATRSAEATGLGHAAQ